MVDVALNAELVGVVDSVSRCEGDVLTTSPGEEDDERLHQIQVRHRSLTHIQFTRNGLHEEEHVLVIRREEAGGVVEEQSRQVLAAHLHLLASQTPTTQQNPPLRQGTTTQTANITHMGNGNHEPLADINVLKMGEGGGGDESSGRRGSWLSLGV